MATTNNPPPAQAAIAEIAQPGQWSGIGTCMAETLGRLRRHRLGLALLVLLVLGLLLPFMMIGWRAMMPDQGSWAHLSSTVLPLYIRNTLLLSVSASALAVIFAVIPAWLLSQYALPGGRWLKWLMLAPLAVPAYIAAYAYTDALQFAGPVQTALRETFGWGRADYWFPNIRTLGGAAVILAAVFYPYIYILSYTAFRALHGAPLQTGRLLGHSGPGLFLRVALPMARPAILAGTLLVVMECLADFGTVQFFAVPTLTTGIYRTWTAMGDTAGAMRLALTLLAFVAVLVLAERWTRSGQRYHVKGAASATALPPMGPLKGMAASVICLIPPLLGFLLPVAFLWRLAGRADQLLPPRTLEAASDTLILAFAGALAVTVTAVLLVRLQRSLADLPAADAAIRLGSLGYAVPGMVMALGVIVLTGIVDHVISGTLSFFSGETVAILVLSGSVGVLIYAYVIRFLTVALSAVRSSAERVHKHHDETARMAGFGAWGCFWRVDLPLWRPGIAAALVLASVEILKELPATLILRPFNLETLAVLAYRYASDERLENAASPALLVITVSLIAVWLVGRAVMKRG